MVLCFLPPPILHFTSPQLLLKCRSSTSPYAKLSLPPGTVLANRYLLLTSLPHPPPATLHTATQTTGPNANARLLIECLPLSEVKSWHLIEAQRQIASLLSRLSHPSLPKLHARTNHETPTDNFYLLITSHPKGKPLSLLPPLSPSLLTFVLTRALSVLTYLEERTPPVTHAAITSENIWLQPHDSKPSVTLSPPHDTYANTSDVYTLAHILANHIEGDPTSLTSPCYAAIGFLLSRILHDGNPDRDTDRVSKIFSSSSAPTFWTPHTAQAALHPAEAPYYAHRIGRSASVERVGSVLRINVEAGGLRVGGISRTAFATAWCGLTAVWTVGVLGTSPIAGFFSVPFWAAGWRMGKSVWREMFGSLEIQMVVDGKYRMVERTRRRGGKGEENVVMEGRTDELRGATALQMGDENHSVGLGILSGVNGVRGETVLVGEGVLCRRDVLCIVEEINSFLLYHGLLSRMALTQGII